MTQSLKRGNTVTWKSHGGAAHGTMVAKVTARMRIGRHVIAASRDEPQFIVETHEGRRAAHKPSALTED